MSREVRVFVNDGSIFQVPEHVEVSRIENYIQEWKNVLFPKAKELNADHFVYCTKSYKPDGVTLEEVNIYMAPLTDAQFCERTDALVKYNPYTYIGAWHKGTAY